MLDIQDAVQIVKREFPEGRIQSYIDYNDVYLFKIFNNRLFEEEMDPFFSVNKETGEFRDFSILVDGDINEIIPLFMRAPKFFDT